MSTIPWEQRFRDVFQRASTAWRAGRRSPKSMFDADDRAFLASIGCTPQELFDFVDDHLVYGDPDPETVLQVTALRREHFLGPLAGRPAARIVPMSELPAKQDAVDGIPWLPRIIVKARLKLAGAMPDDLMYGCAGDREFVRRMRTTLPDLLRLVRDCGDDDRKVVDTVKRTAGLVR